MYCKLCNRKQQLCLCVRRTGTDRKPGLFCNQQGHCKNFDCKFLFICKSCSFCNRVATKQRPNSQLLLSVSRNKDVGQSSSVKNVPTVVPNLLLGARLHHFWEKWAALGISPKVLTVLREGYTLPFHFRPNLTRSPTVTSCYVNPHRNLYPLEALHQLFDKNAVEMVKNQQSLGFYNQLFLVPKPNNQWRPILDLSALNRFLKTESFKMETPETIRTSLQAGEWVTSIDFKDAYFHIPINSQSRKYMHFHIQDKTYSKYYHFASELHQ